MDDLPVTVPQALHDDMSAAMGQPFAVSYLCGALVDRGLLFPRTNVARDRLISEAKAVKVITEHGIHVGNAQRPEDRVEIPSVAEAVRRYDRNGKF